MSDYNEITEPTATPAPGELPAVPPVPGANPLLVPAGDDGDSMNSYLEPT